MRWTSLHHHTSFSAGDGIGMPKHHFDVAADLGISALAMTEHGNVSSHASAEKAAAKLGIKVIFGMEAYTGIDRAKKHLTVLASDEAGYRSLMRMTTQAWKEFHYYPLVHADNLITNQEGLIVLSGCSDSQLAVDLLGGKDVDHHAPDMKAAEAKARKYRDLLGDRFYLEVQMFPELERTRTINSCYEEISNRTGIPLAATADVHYYSDDRAHLRPLVHAASRGGATIEEQVNGWDYDIGAGIPRSDKAIFNLLVQTGLSKRAALQAIHSTEEIAGRCNVTLPKAELFEYPVSEEDMKPWAENAK